MRHAFSTLVPGLVLGLVLGGVVFGGLGIHAVSARDDGEGAPPAPVAPPPKPTPAPTIAEFSAQTARIDAFLLKYDQDSAAAKAELEYLRSREATLSKYILAFANAATHIQAAVAQARTEGFEAAAIPAASRVTLLRMFDHLAADMVGGLPAPTAVEIALRRKADDLRRAAGW